MWSVADIATRIAPLALAIGLLAAADRIADAGPTGLALAVLVVMGGIALAGCLRHR